VAIVIQHRVRSKGQTTQTIIRPPTPKIIRPGDVERLPHLMHLWMRGVVPFGHGIQWTCETFNAWWGCAHAGQEVCKMCYAEGEDWRKQFGGYPHFGTNVERYVVKDARWNDPYIWNERVKDTGEIYPGEGKTVFEMSMGDWMDIDAGVPEEARQRLIRMQRETQHLRHITLTKRPQNYIGRLPRSFADTHPNVMLGLSVDHQDHLDLLPHLFAVEAAGYLLSIEGRSTPIDLTAALKGINGRRVTWVQDGGCSKQYNYKEGRMMEAYPFDPELARDTIRQCREFGVYPFIKQLGSNVIINGNRVELKDGHGGDINEWAELGYEDIMVRELPPMLTD